MIVEERPRANSPLQEAPRPQTRGGWFSRHSVVINFWLDAALLVLFMVQAWMFSVLHFVFPRGADERWRVWGGNPLDWSESLFATFCLFAVGIAVHLMLHWAWICGVVSSKLLQRKAGKDDGSQTLIGVGLIVVLAHILAAALFASRLGLTSPG